MTGIPRGRRLRRVLVPLAVAAIVAAGPTLPIRLNLTPSLPRGIYLETADSPARGRLALACLPAPVARLGIARGYLHPGSCPSGAAPVLKKIAAMTGDRVTLTAAGVSVSGRVLPASAPRAADAAGRPLAPQPPVPRRLAPGQLWLHAPRPDSWDSRYYGPVPQAAILTTMRPLLVLPGRRLPRSRPR